MGLSDDDEEWPGKLMKLITNPRLYLSKRSARGRKNKWDIKAMKQQIKEVPLRRRRSWRSLSEATGIPRATLHCFYRKGHFRRVTKNGEQYILTCGDSDADDSDSDEQIKGLKSSERVGRRTEHSRTGNGE